ncbi:hypothetical protein B0H17DRAFT_1124940 [Mycena rosella]|uniref:Uncharacterized protein n=1 Tax=Mycena rosella TaxID=1033263 RepID=A0AAD7GYJ6_MYCRO|nr:hypothetical protein B0H17DRAFT_1124940 [Mycena rosella]
MSIEYHQYHLNTPKNERNHCRLGLGNVQTPRAIGIYLRFLPSRGFGVNNIATGPRFPIRSPPHRSRDIVARAMATASRSELSDLLGAFQHHRLNISEFLVGLLAHSAFTDHPAVDHLLSQPKTRLISETPKSFCADLVAGVLGRASGGRRHRDVQPDA